MAILEMWLDGPEYEDSAGWRVELAVNMTRFHEGGRYTEIVNAHIQRSLEHLADEIQEIGIVI